MTSEMKLPLLLKRHVRDIYESWCHRACYLEGRMNGTLHFEGSLLIFISWKGRARDRMDRQTVDENWFYICSFTPKTPTTARAELGQSQGPRTLYGFLIQVAGDQAPELSLATSQDALAGSQMGGRVAGTRTGTSVWDVHFLGRV